MIADIEKQLISHVLIDNKIFTEVSLHYSQFSDLLEREIWISITKIINNNTVADKLTLLTYLENNNKLNSEITKYIKSLPEPSTPPSSCSDIIRENSIRENLGKLARDIYELKEHGKDSDFMLSEISDRLQKIEGLGKRELPTINFVSDNEVNQLRNDMLEIIKGKRLRFGLLTGLGFNSVIPGGIPRGKITVVYGESGNFKTTLKNNIIWGIAKHNDTSVIDCTFEDDNILAAQRFLAKNSGVGYGRIATRKVNSDEVNLLEEFTSIDYGNSVYLGGDIQPNIDEVIRISRAYSNQNNVSCVVIDYIQLMVDDKQEMDYAMRQLQLSAKRDNLSYIVVSQVKQDVDFRASQGKDARPRVTDMLGSSTLRTAPKLALGVYRPWHYHKHPEKPTSRKPNYRNLVEEHPKGLEIYKSILEIWVQKNVLGESEVVIPLLVDLPTGAIIKLPQEVKELL